MAFESEEAIERTVRCGAVRVGAKRFFCPELTAYENQRVLVSWDSTDEHKQVWVGNLAGHLIGVAQLDCKCLMLADVLRDAFDVVKTVEGEDSDEAGRLSDLRIRIEYALAGYDEQRIEEARLGLMGYAEQGDSLGR